MDRLYLIYSDFLFPKKNKYFKTTAFFNSRAGKSSFGRIIEFCDERDSGLYFGTVFFETFYFFCNSSIVAAAQESQRNRYITAWFSSFTPAWFFTGFD